MPRRLFQAEIVAGRTEGVPGDQTEVLRPEGIDGWVLHLHRAGACRVGRGSDGFRAGPGDLLLVPPGVAHDYGADPAVGHWDHRWVWFFPRAGWHDLLAWPERGSGIRALHADGSDGERLDRLLLEMAQILALPWRRRTEAAMALLEQILLWCDRLHPGSVEGALDARVRAAQELLAGQLEAAWSVAALARRVGLSPSRLAHRFRAEVGEPPLAWLERQRIERAGSLLVATGQTIAQIGAAVGYDDPQHFSRVFRRRVGIPPSVYRQQGGGPMPDWWRAE